MAIGLGNEPIICSVRNEGDVLILFHAKASQTQVLNSFEQSLYSKLLTSVFFRTLKSELESLLIRFSEYSPTNLLPKVQGICQFMIPFISI